MAGTANGKPKRSAPSPSGRANKKSKGDAIYDDPDAVLENNKSPLYEEDTDLMAVLNHPKALAIMIADSSEPQSPLSFAKSEQMKTDIAAFKSDGRGGCYDRDWVRQAFAASASRANGEYADYEKERFEADWGDAKVEQNDDDQGSEQKEPPQE